LDDNADISELGKVLERISELQPELGPSP